MMNGIGWSEQELDMLLTLLGELPPELLISEYNRWAKRHGFVIRTPTSIRGKIYRMGLKTMPDGEYITATMAASLLGCGHDVIASWVRRGWLRGLKIGSKKNSKVWIRRSDLRALAKRKPEYFNGRSYQGLIYLLEDEDLVDKITSTKWQRCYGRPRPVVMLSTGRRFGSMKAAAQAIGVGQSTLRESVVNGWMCAGSRWTFARID